MELIALFPYLMLEERAAIDGWELIPADQLGPDDALSPEILEAAPKYLALYRLPEGGVSGQGCFAKPPGGKLGSEFSPELMRPLHLAAVAALLEMNRPLDAKEANLTDFSSTSDNALLYAHRYTADGFVAVEYGTMVRHQTMGLQAGSAHALIEHPLELHLPTFGCRLDAEYADALHRVLSQPDDLARRLAVTIDWLDIAWRNTHSITHQTRVVALRSAFEALLDVGEGVGPGRDALSKLLRDKSAKAPRTWTTREGSKKTQTLSDLEWWFTRFAFLRNFIMHGAPLAEADYEHEGRLHLTVADEILRRALRRTVADCGFPDIALALKERLGERIVKEAAAVYEHITRQLLAQHFAQQEEPPAPPKPSKS